MIQRTSSGGFPQQTYATFRIVELPKHMIFSPTLYFGLSRYKLLEWLPSAKKIPGNGFLPSHFDSENHHGLAGYGGSFQPGLTRKTLQDGPPPDVFVGL